MTQGVATSLTHSARKTAILKNRAYPKSALLQHIQNCLPVLRLEDQLSHLTEQAEETTKTREAQNAYTTSLRIKSIELIIFVSTILGLAVAVNALQMKPFHDGNTENALSRPIFWWVFAVIVGAGGFLWGGDEPMEANTKTAALAKATFFRAS